jgi:hypothetical protein
LAYDHGDGETWLQRLPGGEIVGRLSNGEAALLDMVFSEDGSMLAVRGRDGMVIIWRIQEENQGAYKVTYQNSFESVNENGSMVFSPDNIYLTTSGTYGDVVMWSIFSGEMFIVTSSFQDRRIDSMSFTPSGGLLAVLVEDEVSLWKPNQEITYRYFNQATESLYKEGLPHPLAEGNDIPEIIEFSQLVMNKFGKISEAANLIPFPLLVPTRLPEFINITDVVLYTNDIVCLEYGFPQQQTNYSSLYICEKYIGNSGPPIMKVGPDADIISLEIETMSGPKKAEYVYGDWYQARMGNSDSLMRSGLPDDAWIWDKNSSSQRLRWVQYGILVSVYYQVDDPFTAVLDGDVIRITRDSYNPYVNQTDLMQIAVGMRKYKEVSNYYYLDEGG